MKNNENNFLSPHRGLGSDRRCGLLIALLALTLSCKKEDRTTVVFGTVKNEINQPIEGIEMVLYGEKGILASRSTELKSTKTNAQGEYTITAEISKDYHSGSVLYNWYGKPPLYDTYKGGGGIYFNGQKTQDCCPLVVGQKSQYDFVLERK